ncbi:MAG: transposase [Methylobacter sp.]|uniref:transposase n=1 Tax=Methylobacter sp. TaxID=2051955 RepID=UPI002730827A|nr:transposase [Methylobacter sp.]MDP1666951.1 transposase [Methylobacter sp.]
MWLILQHVLPKGFRRTRNFGFLHSNSKRVLELLYMLFKLNPVKTPIGVVKRPPIKRPCCGGGAIRIEQPRIPPRWHSGGLRHPAN